jgi:hypothetical protein
VTRTQIRNHLLVAAGVLILATMLGLHLGLHGGHWWLLVGVVAVLHLGAFGALITWIVRRVRRLRTDG